MTLIRRIILALALSAGIFPALAQVPPPVPALPDTERRTAYTINASTCACNVNFALYGDSTDFQNWVEVYLNGVRVNYNDATYGWTITSPTGALASIPRPVTDAVLTFTSAQTGAVQIVGARRPRRVSQFSENAGVSARSLNQALTDIIAQNRETWDKTNDVTGRAVLAPAGETLNLLPVLASRQNMGACFDINGNLTSCVSVPTGTFSAVSPIIFTGTNPTTISCPTCALGSANTFIPEEFYQTADGANWGPAFDRAMVAISSLPGGGNLQLGCGTTYTVGSVSPNGKSAIRLFSNVSIVGCGDSSVIKMANGLNTSSAFVWGLYATGTASNVRYDYFTIDMNGANNSCGGTCYFSNAALGIATGDNISSHHVRVINNPGSNDFVFGTNASPPTIANLHVTADVHEHSGDAVNAASADFSATFVIASNSSVIGSRYSDGPRVNGAAFEAHGVGVVFADQTIVDYDNCGIVANLAGSPVAGDITLSNIVCRNVKSGLQVYSFASATETNVNINNVTVDFLAGASGPGIDACSNIDPATGTNTNLTISNSTINSNVTTNLGTDTSGICVGKWKSVTVNGNTTFNTQGPGIRFISQVAGENLMANNNLIINPGRTANTALQIGIGVDATAGVTVNTIGIQNNILAGSMLLGVNNAQNAVSGFIQNIAASPTVLPFQNSGTGVTALNYGANVAATLNNSVNSANGLLAATGAGFLSAVNEPAHTGDCTNSAGSLALTCLKTNGVNFGTAATASTGTSGATVPLLNGANTWSGPQTHSGQIISTFGTPTIASGACGTGSNGTISGTNQSGTITIGSATTTSCAVSFSATITAPSSCHLTPANATAAQQSTTGAFAGTPGTTGWTITGLALASTVYRYLCL